MGYESRFYLIEGSLNFPDENGLVYARVLFSFNAGKLGELAETFRKLPATKNYIYSDEGDIKITRDKYDKPLTDCSLCEAIRLIEKFEFDYDLRYTLYPLLSILKSYKILWGDISRLRVLHYGY